MTDPMFSGDLGFLSNFDKTPFNVHALGAIAPTGEHAFNALKTLDSVERQAIIAAPTPAASKRLGRKCTLRPGWDSGVRVAAMSTVLAAKFSVPKLEASLLATGNLKLIETNSWHDQFWGDCFCSKHAGTPGQNMLGELLMAIRAKKIGL